MRSSDRFVAAADYADHVRDAAGAARLDVRAGATVTLIEQDGATLVVHLADGPALRTHDVVVATGQNEVPVEPHLPGRSRFAGDLLHADTYRTGAQFRGRRVLVVGAGNTGSELAQDLVEHGAAGVSVAIRAIPAIVPRSMGPFTSHGIAYALRGRLGTAVMRRATAALGKLRGRRLQRLGLHPPSPTSQLRVPTLDHGFVAEVAAGRVHLVDALVDLDETGALLADGTHLPCDAVVLATGYRPGARQLLAPSLADGLTDEQLADPIVLGAARRVWFVGFGASPLGQLVLAREQAEQVATGILSR